MFIGGFRLVPLLEGTNEAMRLRTARDLGPILRENRRRKGWSQTDLAEKVGVSRQWVSLVETGKTSVEFDLVLAVLRALGFQIQIREVTEEDLPTQDPSSRPEL